MTPRWSCVGCFERRTPAAAGQQRWPCATPSGLAPCKASLVKPLLQATAAQGLEERAQVGGAQRWCRQRYTHQTRGRIGISLHAAGGNKMASPLCNELKLCSQGRAATPAALQRRRLMPARSQGAAGAPPRAPEVGAAGLIQLLLDRGRGFSAGEDEGVCEGEVRGLACRHHLRPGAPPAPNPAPCPQRLPPPAPHSSTRHSGCCWNCLCDPAEMKVLATDMAGGMATKNKQRAAVELHAAEPNPAMQ